MCVIDGLDLFYQLIHEFLTNIHSICFSRIHFLCTMVNCVIRTRDIETERTRDVPLIFIGVGFFGIRSASIHRCDKWFKVYMHYKWNSHRVIKVFELQRATRLWHILALFGISGSCVTLVLNCSFWKLFRYIHSHRKGFLSCSALF
jgi:hypothetical protein